MGFNIFVLLNYTSEVSSWEIKMTDEVLDKQRGFHKSP